MNKPEYLKLQDFITYEDVTYEFKQGQVTIVIGENKDDAKQKGNGSGKSALLEGICFAVKGTSIRDVVTKELVRNGSDSAHIELGLRNERTDQWIIIKRVIYANTKSSEYSMSINGEWQTDRYSDANMFNTYVWKVLGISKEDFESFFLITGDNYKPFLKSSDTKKKEVVNRFSGAYKVDGASPLIEAEIAAIDVDKRKVENAIISVNAKMEVWQEEIDRLKAIPEPTLEEIVAEDTKLIEEKEEELEVLKAQYMATKGEWGEIGFNIATFPEKDYDKLIGHEEDEKCILNDHINTLDKDMKNLSKRFDLEVERVDIDTREKACHKEFGEIRDQLEEFKALKTEIENTMHSAINCPKCHHVFSLQDKSYNRKEAEETLVQLTDEIKDATELLEHYKQESTTFYVERTSYKKKISDIEDEYREDILKAKTAMIELKGRITEYETARKQQVTDLKNLKDNYASLQKKYEANLLQQEVMISTIQAMYRNIELAQDHVGDGESENQRKIKELQNNIDAKTQELQILESGLQTITESRASKDRWLTNFKNFKSHLANKSIKNISDYSNMYLQAMGSNLSVSIEGYRIVNKKLKEEINTQVLRNGFDEGSYGKFSAGERGRIDISVILAMQELINLNSPTGGLDFLGCDEILESIDVLGLESIVQALGPVEKTIMIISQNQINSLADQTLTVQKQNGVSTILC